jgi:hypothetical protein
VANSDTVNSIETNLRKVIKAGGINVSDSTFDKDTPRSKMPIAEINYEGELMGYNHGQKPLYNGIQFRIRILIDARDERAKKREFIRILHLIRDNVTINALNIGDLASSKLVSKVTTEDTDSTLSDENIGILEYDLQVRYREL